MNCSNRGAPMILYREQEYFRYEYCGSYRFPSASRDGVRPLGPAPEDVHCPVCAEHLHLMSLDDRHRGYQCPKCRGLLLECAAFADVTAARRAWATEPPDAPGPLNRDHLARRVTCPLCHRPMSTHPYAGPGMIVVDTCDQCLMIWLDYGELARVINAPGRDRGAALLREEHLRRAKQGDDDDDDEDDARRKRRRRRGEIDLTDFVKDLFG